MPAKPITTADASALPLAERVTLNIDEAAALTGLPRTFLREAVAAGIVRSTKPGKRRLLFTKSLLHLLDRAETKKLRVRAVAERATACAKAAGELKPGPRSA